MKLAKCLIAFFVLTICYHQLTAEYVGPSSAHGRRRGNTRVNTQNMREYNNYLHANKVFRRYYHSQFNPKVVKGRCKQTPIWDINGTYPVLDEVKKGNAVFLFLMKKTCRRCWFEVQSLHDWAKWYKIVGAKAKIMVLNHRNYGRIPYGAKKAYKYIKFIDEPKDKNIFGQLKASFYDILMYDKCGRHLYHYGQPWSSLWQPFVKHAMKNTLNHWKTFCGDCKPIVMPTPAVEQARGEPEFSPELSPEIPPEFPPGEREAEIETPPPEARINSH